MSKRAFRPFMVLAAIALGLLLAYPAIARDVIANPSGIPVPWSKERDATSEDIGRAIVKGCSVRGWSCRIESPGKIRAVLHVRRHMAETTIDYDTKTYSITYVDSRELDYDSTTQKIHRKYNGWINNLIADINEAIAAIP